MRPILVCGRTILQEVPAADSSARRWQYMSYEPLLALPSDTGARERITLAAIAGSPHGRLTNRHLRKALEAFQGTSDELEAIDAALEGSSGLTLLANGRLAAQGLPAERDVPLVERSWTVAALAYADERLSLGDQERLHYALRGGMGRPLTPGELQEAVARARHVLVDAVLWSLVLDGVFVVDVTRSEPRFRHSPALDETLDGAAA